MVRRIVRIDEEKCDGCGLCVPACHEGALQIVDGKARLVSEALCDGIGDCLGECPQGAIRIEEVVEAPAPVRAPAEFGGCPGSRMRTLRPSPGDARPVTPGGHPVAHAPATPRSERELAPDDDRRNGILSDGGDPSFLGHWPLKIRLVPPHAPFLEGADLVVTADCVPVALPGFHDRVVPDRAILIGCPKFDDTEEYAARFAALFSQVSLRSVTALVMEVPCCQGLPMAMLRGMAQAGRNLPVEMVVVGVDGEIRGRRSLRPADLGLAAR